MFHPKFALGAVFGGLLAFTGATWLFTETPRDAEITVWDMKQDDGTVISGANGQWTGEWWFTVTETEQVFKATNGQTIRLKAESGEINFTMKGHWNNDGTFTDAGGQRWQKKERLGYTKGDRMVGGVVWGVYDGKWRMYFSDNAFGVWHPVPTQ